MNPLTLAWFGPLADRYRLVAPDTIGQPGRSAPVRVSANDASLAEWTALTLTVLLRSFLEGAGGRPES